MKLFSFRIFAISTLSFESGMSTRRCFAPQALRMRVSISAIGSVILIKSSSSVLPYPVAGTRRNEWLPACLADARDVARQRHLSETDSAEPELSQESARSSAPSAAIVLPHRELRLPLALLHHGLTRHYNLSWLLVDTYCCCCVMIGLSSPRKGIPSSRSSANAWSSLFVVVTIVMSIPWICSTMS